MRESRSEGDAVMPLGDFDAYLVRRVENATRLRIRRALAPHVKRLRKDVCGVEQANIAKAIDAATRAPRKGKKRGK